MSVDRATQLLDVSRCGFYKWQRQSNDEPVKSEDREVRNEIHKVAVEFPAYGYRRITVELRNRGYTVNHKRYMLNKRWTLETHFGK
ncbi:MAG: transposase [Methanophagales archaeon ANME-1-THS]|nr:MAG: transposase [Methanophagales archaeon ANME-1-THS]